MDPLSLFLQPLGEYLIKQVATLMKDECLTILNVNQNLNELSDAIKEMHGILEAAEGRRMKTSHGDNLLNKLNEAFYDAEDLLADCLLAARQLSMSSEVDEGITGVRLQSSSTFSYPREFYLRHKFGWKVKRMASKIQGVFDKIKEDSSRANDFQQLRPEPSNICPATEDTSGLMLGRSSSIVGINENESRLVNLLTRGSSSSDGVTAVYAVTGMPGIGKTTLARKVINNDQVQTQFEVCEWVCVSRNYDRTELLRQVIRQISGQDTIDARREAELLPMLCNLVKDKRVLLVLDDVWETDACVNCFTNPLSRAANGSAVLITSRYRGVAEQEIVVDPLSEDDGWSLLCKVAFSEDDGQEEILSFRSIGREMVRKCKGVPLSIKAIGGVLKDKRDISQWQKVSANKIWNSKELPEEKKSLLLSYLDLGFQLKLCFTFCSLFPEDFKFHHQNLVQLWVAEGFVIASPGEEIEVEGERCYKELISRNLLQEAPEYFEGKGCMMHDLMRELGQSIVCMRADGPNTHPMVNRHLYHVQKDLTTFPRIPVKPASLRTLMLSRNPAMKTIDGFLFKKFLHLRVLDLSYTGIETLPNSLGKLVQLRHLNVSFSRLKALPSSIGKLSNLQSVLVNGCKNLTKLPVEVVYLQNLRHLNLGSGHAQIVRLPTGIGKLMQLRILQGFAIDDCGSNIKELKRLSNLTNLSLYQLEKVASKEEAEEADLINKTMLTYLKLSCTPITDVDAKAMDMDKINNIHLVFEGLRLPRNLEAIHIEGFFGQEFPSWINQRYLPKLKWFRLEDCKLCLQLPPLGQLQKLKVLDVRGAVAVQKIGSEFFGNATFPKLEELYFIRLAEFSEWSGLREGTLPCLKKLHIMKCPKLIYLPDGLSHVQSLKELVVELTSLRAIKKLPSVVELRITRNFKLKKLINLPLLKLMHVRRCPSLVEIENVNELKHLVFLDHRMEALPGWLVGMTKLQRLDVKGNNTLVTRCYKDKEDWCKIHHIQRVEVRLYKEDVKVETTSAVPDTTQEKNLYISYTKYPYSFDSNYEANTQDGSSSLHC